MHDEKDELPFFPEDEASAIARHGEMLELNASIERDWCAAIDREMRDAGFAPVGDDRLARFAVPADQWGAAAYTRNGLVVCRACDGWCVRVQGTGQLLANLPEPVNVVSRFVGEVERMTFWPLVREVGPALRDQLQVIAKRR